MKVVESLFLIALAVTALRLAILAGTPTDLFFDEAQYWAWGQSYEWGYFSKPPLIGWVIGSVTALSGSDSTFWVRAAAPVFHGATAIIIGLWLATIHRPAAIWGAVIYLSMPILSIGSWMISTDTIMAPFFAGALWAWWRHLETQTVATAVVAGVLAGLATLAKYAGAYFWLAVFVSMLTPTLRPRKEGLGAAFLAFLIVIAPNIYWNIQNGFVTLSHTAENARWGSAWDLHWSSFLEFGLAQTVVIGPVFFVVWLTSIKVPLDRAEKFMLSASLPILGIVCLQALLAKANANWAFAAYLSAAPLVALRLVRLKMRLPTMIGLSVNAILVLAVSVLIVRPDIAPRLTDRYMGRTNLMAAILVAADGRPVAADERQILADLTYAAKRDGGVAKILAMTHEGSPRHWYDMAAARSGNSAFVYVTADSGPNCLEDATVPETILAAETGAYSGRRISLFAVPANCE